MASNEKQKAICVILFSSILFLRGVHHSHTIQHPEKSILLFFVALPRNAGGLRDSSNRDPLAVLWKEKCRRVVQHTSGV